MSVIHNPTLQQIIDELYAKNDSQFVEIQQYMLDAQFKKPKPTKEQYDIFRSDKMLALYQDKAEFCYQICRAINARQIIEVGTAYGVSTLYLAAALQDNICMSGGGGKIIGTEFESAKVISANKTFEKAEVNHLIELREGNLLDTLQQLDGPIDFVLIDAWVNMALPALKLIYPHLRHGSVVICDDIIHYRKDYADYSAFITDPSNKFKTTTIPFQGGLEFSIKL